MFFSEHLCEGISRTLNGIYGSKAKVEFIHSVSGGSINQCFKIRNLKTNYFLKANSALKYPGMFFAEAEGLRTIAKTATISTPAVIACGISDDTQFLILEWIEEGQGSIASQLQLGAQLALLHKNTAENYGLGHNNYIGSLSQSNSWHAKWEEFFINERIKPQVDIAKSKGVISSSILRKIEKLCGRLSNLFPVEVPALVHGDLWSGNYLISSSDTPFLIDPSASFAHREVDIAMSKLFGGFDQSFYRSYHEAYPLISGWQERVNIWNLYPLLVHLNLFGRRYMAEIDNILDNYL